MPKKDFLLEQENMNRYQTILWMDKVNVWFGFKPLWVEPAA